MYVVHFYGNGHKPTFQIQNSIQVWIKLKSDLGREHQPRGHCI